MPFLKFIPVFLLNLLAFSVYAQQTTAIPDVNFEQVLIDQGIDSDGVINGQVLTSDISSLTSFNFNANNIEDFTGLEDFSALETLFMDNVNFGFNNFYNEELDLSSIVNLESFTMFGGDDAQINYVDQLDLSNNFNLNNIQVPANWYLKQIDLKTGTTDVSNLDINIDIGFPLPPPTEGVAQSFQNEDFCIKVTDAVAATTGQGVYATWTISAINNPYFFSETCTLGVDEFDINSVSIYPNPTYDKVYIQAKQMDINSVEVYNLQGQLVLKNLELNNRSIDVDNLAQGVYVLKINTEKAVFQKKLIKK